MNPKRLPPKKLFDNPGGKVASLNPNNLGRWTQSLYQGQEIPIRADHGAKLCLPRPIEYEGIGSSHEIVIIHSLKSGNDVL